MPSGMAMKPSGSVTIGTPAVKEGELIDRVYDSVTSSDWRRTALDDLSSEDVKRKIYAALSTKIPLEFSVPFGGYKGWAVPNCPHINWAEVFFFSYLQSSGERIAAVFPYGVVFSFSYVSGVLDWVSNYPLDWQETYVAEFSRLASRFSRKDISFKVVDIASQYESRADLQAELAENFRAVCNHWDASSEEIAKHTRSASRNLVPHGVLDYSHLSVQEWDTLVNVSARRCEALDRLKLRRQFNKFSSRIQLVLIRGPIPALHIGSCRTSVCQPWVGVGCVEDDNQGGCIERIVGSDAFARNADVSYYLVPMDLRLDSPYLSILPAWSKPEIPISLE